MLKRSAVCHTSASCSSAPPRPWCEPGEGQRAFASVVTAQQDEFMSKSLRLVLARERCTRGGAACPIIVQEQACLGTSFGPLQRHIADHTSGLTIMVSFVAGVAVQNSCAPLAIAATAGKTREAPQPATKPFPSRILRMPFPGWLPCSRRCHSPASAPRRSFGILPLLGLVVPPPIHTPTLHIGLLGTTAAADRFRLLGYPASPRAERLAPVSRDSDSAKANLSSDARTLVTAVLKS